jgi:hypothetical protein
MSDPPRLVDDPNAPSALRDALALTRKAPAPLVDVAAGARRLEDAIKNLPPASAPAPGGSLATGLWAGGALVVGLSVALLVRGALHTAPPAVPTQQPAPRAITEVRPPAPTLTAPEVTPTPAPELTPTIARAEPPRTPRRVRPTLAPSPAPAPTPAPSVTPPTPAEEPPPVDTLRAQITHLARTRAALARDPSESLRLAEQGLRDYRGGVFDEELEALSVLSLARLGRRDEARARGTRFLTQHPRSPFRARIEEALGSP